MSWQMDSPLISGRLRSRMTRTGWVRWTSSKAEVPSYAVWTEKPLSVRISWTNWLRSLSSSTTNIVFNM